MVNVVSESRFTDIRSRSGIEIAQGLLDSPGHAILVIILTACEDVINPSREQRKVIDRSLCVRAFDELVLVLADECRQLVHFL